MMPLSHAERARWSPPTAPQLLQSCLQLPGVLHWPGAPLPRRLLLRAAVGGWRKQPAGSSRSTAAARPATAGTTGASVGVGRALFAGPQLGGDAGTAAAGPGTSCSSPCCWRASTDICGAGGGCCSTRSARVPHNTWICCNTPGERGRGEQQAGAAAAGRSVLSTKTKSKAGERGLSQGWVGSMYLGAGSRGREQQRDCRACVA